jgi:putative phosphoesterase
MRLAILSDIHGNAFGLDAALRDMERFSPDQVVCLGDAIQGGPQPAECVSILREKKWPVVMGNADAWLLSGIETGGEVTDEERRKELNDVRDWSLAELSEADKEYIATFQPTITIDLTKDAEVLCFHGSPASFDEILLPTMPDEELARVFSEYEQRIFCGGHTHVQFVRHLKRRMFFNPGSVGFAYRHGQDPSAFRADPWAEYAILTVDDSSSGLEFRRVGYDVRPLIEVYRNSGRPHADAAIRQYSR